MVCVKENENQNSHRLVSAILRHQNKRNRHSRPNYADIFPGYKMPKAHLLISGFFLKGNANPIYNGIFATSDNIRMEVNYEKAFYCFFINIYDARL